MTRAGVKRHCNHRLLTNWLNPRCIFSFYIFSRCARAYTRFADRRGHRRYCLHRSNLLMARSTRWIRDRVSCVVCMPIARRDRHRGPSDRGSITQEEERTRLRRSISSAYYRSILGRNLRRLSFRLPWPLIVRAAFDDNRSDEGNGPVSIYVTFICMSLPSFF